jgi:hypothetical protein
VVSFTKRKVEFPGKNYTELDTLVLSWKDTVLTVPHEVMILAGPKNPAGSFIVEPLSVVTENSTKVAVCSSIEHSPLEGAVRRLGVAPIAVDADHFHPYELAGVSAVIVDQFSIDKFIAAGKVVDSVEQWVKQGGKLVVLPQVEMNTAASFLSDGISFTHLSAEDCSATIFADTAAHVMSRPNKLEIKEFTEGPFPLFYNEVLGGKSDSKVLMKSGDRILLLEQPLGRGKIFYCSLNLFPRLLTIDNASYGLLANLIRAESE